MPRYAKRSEYPLPVSRTSFFLLLLFFDIYNTQQPNLKNSKATITKTVVDTVVDSSCLFLQLVLFTLYTQGVTTRHTWERYKISRQKSAHRDTWNERLHVSHTHPVVPIRGHGVSFTCGTIARTTTTSWLLLSVHLLSILNFLIYKDKKIAQFLVWVGNDRLSEIISARGLQS